MTTRKPSKKPRVVKAWGGFTDGTLHQWQIRSNVEFAIYPTRTQARRFFEDVRRVEIREVKK